MEKTNNKFGNSLKALREENKLSLTKLSAATGIAQTTLSSWELGKYRPNLDDCIKLASFFQVSLDELAGLKK